MFFRTSSHGVMQRGYGLEGLPLCFWCYQRLLLLPLRLYMCILRAILTTTVTCHPPAQSRLAILAKLFLSDASTTLCPQTSHFLSTCSRAAHVSGNASKLWISQLPILTLSTALTTLSLSRAFTGSCPQAMCPIPYPREPGRHSKSIELPKPAKIHGRSQP